MTEFHPDVSYSDPYTYPAGVLQEFCTPIREGSSPTEYYKAAIGAFGVLKGLVEMHTGITDPDHPVLVAINMAGELLGDYVVGAAELPDPGFNELSAEKDDTLRSDAWRHGRAYLDNVIAAANRHNEKGEYA